MTLHLNPEELEGLRTDPTVDIRPAGRHWNKRRQHFVNGVKIATVIGVISAASFAFYQNYEMLNAAFQAIGSVFNHIADQDRKISEQAQHQQETDAKIQELHEQITAISKLIESRVQTLPTNRSEPRIDPSASQRTSPKGPHKIERDRRLGPILQPPSDR
jgi:septal ring factor EnvC (AmiA/AmiB activator)